MTNKNNAGVYRDRWNVGVADTVRTHTTNWVVVSHRYRHHSSSCWVRDRAGERLEMVKSLPKQQFEVDCEPKDHDATLEEDRVSIIIILSHIFLIST
jgi:hypothetical protein